MQNRALHDRVSRIFGLVSCVPSAKPQVAKVRKVRLHAGIASQVRFFAAISPISVCDETNGSRVVRFGFHGRRLCRLVRRRLVQNGGGMRPIRHSAGGVHRRAWQSDPSGRLARMAHWHVWRVDPAGLPGPPHFAACCAAGRDSACRTPARLMPVARRAAFRTLAQSLSNAWSSRTPAHRARRPPGPLAT